jgi:dTDP-4-dehydrorhamnose reductase
VQRAEREPDRAFAVNRDGAMLVARYCARRGARLIHVSTDFVFDGRARRPYDESHPPAPANIYGASKLAGELEVLRCCPGALIVRTSWLYGLGRINFVEKVLAQARAGAGLSVVSDQRGRPTYAADLADAIWRLRDRRHRGIVHFANSGICSWFELAQRVLQRSGFDPAQVRPIRSDQLAPGQPPRPSYSALGLGKYRRWTGGNPPAWKPALDRYLAARRAAGFAETAEQIA